MCDLTPPEARRTRAVSLLSTFIKGFQDYTLFLWKRRNDVLHEAGSDGIATVHATLNHDITQMYSLKDTLHSQLQCYFATPLEARLRSTPRQRSRWLQLVQLASSHPSATGPRQTTRPIFFHVDSDPSTDVPRTGTVIHRTVSIVPAIMRQVPITSFVTPRTASPH